MPDRYRRAGQGCPYYRIKELYSDEINPSRNVSGPEDEIPVCRHGRFRPHVGENLGCDGDKERCEIQGGYPGDR